MKSCQLSDTFSYIIDGIQIYAACYNFEESYDTVTFLKYLSFLA